MLQRLENHFSLDQKKMKAIFHITIKILTKKLLQLKYQCSFLSIFFLLKKTMERKI